MLDSAIRPEDIMPLPRTSLEHPGPSARDAVVRRFKPAQPEKIDSPKFASQHHRLLGDAGAKEAYASSSRSLSFSAGATNTVAEQESSALVASAAGGSRKQGTETTP